MFKILTIHYHKLFSFQVDSYVLSDEMLSKNNSKKLFTENSDRCSRRFTQIKRTISENYRITEIHTSIIEIYCTYRVNFFLWKLAISIFLFEVFFQQILFS